MWYCSTIQKHSLSGPNVMAFYGALFFSSSTYLSFSQNLFWNIFDSFYCELDLFYHFPFLAIYQYSIEKAIDFINSHDTANFL